MTTFARNLLGGAVAAGLGLAGVLAGVAVLGGSQLAARIPTVVADVDFTWAPTPLGALFMILVGAVAVVAALFGVGYAHGPSASASAWVAVGVFVAAMLGVCAAGDVVTFLACWEAMALASTLLVMAEHRQRRSVRSAGLWYATMAHVSFALIASGFGLLAADAGSVHFDDIARASLHPSTSNLAFALLVVGFAAKSGAVPLHIWLPRAHPEAPSHVSALMSAAMVKLGLFGIVLTFTQLMPGGPTWWGLLLLALGLPSALLGILQASVAADIKKLLAYSTTENVGLILTALAVAALTRTSSTMAISHTALVVALLLCVSHACFKTTLFLGAGALLHATGERSLDRLGGLARRMPVTAVTMGIGALGAASLPVTSGFAAEWSLLQTLIHADARTDRLTTALLPLTIGVVALTAGLAILTFVKAYGIAFLARPRSEGADAAREVPFTMRLALGLAAASVLAVGLLPGLVGQAVNRALDVDVVRVTGLGGVGLPAVHATLDVTTLFLWGLACGLPVLIVATVYARRRPRRHVDLAWGCGLAATSPRMQYNATSYAEPLVRVFDNALSPQRDVDVTHVDEARAVERSVRFRQELADVVETKLYRPVVRALLWAADRARAVQNGSVHRYVMFSFVALVAVLWAVSL